MSKTVADVMTADPVTVSPDTPLKEAIKLLVEKRISGLPVVDETGAVIGVISESDLMWQETGPEPPPFIMFLDSVIYLQNPSRFDKELHKALGQTVAEVMSDRPITVLADLPLPQAARLMHEKQVRRLPVLNSDKQLIGIITQGDIIRSMAEA
ncbi:MAG: CBS domain-containing protein [Jaaginema sp. PMC 1079.18]|nr:CBS domain-containing protein [Jaaginema sp. PMC 1080.18]MEC4851285.1 CBS domain-containing protein [Jaaginema sp. PMC 1079.18]MEC4865497.1 CBS domain-containing protein [Jaaginema sp. PMC 1078.18]